MVEMDRFGIQKGAISNLNEYKAVPGVRDYLFFNYNLYDDSLRDFLKTHSDITGIVFIDFNSEFKPDVSNLYILRRPITTQKIASLLNDDDKDTLVREEEGAYTINITAPDADILIVDDNPINLAIAEGLLATMEMKIDTAMSGKEAIDMIKKKDYDIVFMDHMMPEMDGVDATKIIRDTLKSSEELVIIALTANAVEEAKQQFFEVGMNDFVAKPIDIKELVSKIKRWLPEEKIIDGTK
jgi:CheY-like chemotaxis protein